MGHRPDFPAPIAVFRAWGDIPRYEDVMNQQIKDVIAKRGRGDLSKLLRAGDTWEVKQTSHQRKETCKGIFRGCRGPCGSGAQMFCVFRLSAPRLRILFPRVRYPSRSLL